MQNKTKRTVTIIITAAVVIFLLIQIVPLKLTNPPVTAEPEWDSAGTRALARRACFDCHSNETVWPWYAHVAPVKWLVVHDVTEGRDMFNFSDWHGELSGAHLSAAISRGRMPLPIYLMMHPQARLTAQEKEQLGSGLVASLK